MRRLPALLAAALLAGAMVLPATPAGAATSSTHPRITTLLSSSQWIVYRQKTTGTNLRPLHLVGGSIFATDISGQRQSLPGFDNSKAFLFLTGSILVQAQNRVHTNDELQTVRWRNLNDRTTGTVQNTAGGVLVAAAPDGWIMQASTDEDGTYGSPQQLTYVHLDGTRADLGEPFPKGQSFGLSVSDTGILATPASRPRCDTCPGRTRRAGGPCSRLRSRRRSAAHPRAPATPPAPCPPLTRTPERPRTD
jgi:hypothetical protein